MRILRIVLCIILLSPTHLFAQHCGGKERWAVKDGTDVAARLISFGTISPIGVADLLQIKEPTLPGDDTTRVVPDETQLYRVTARLIKWRKECCKATDDSDYHLVMTDDTQQFSDENNGVPVTGHSFVAELPDPNCLSGRSGNFGTSSPFFQPANPLNVAIARKELEQHTPTAVFDGKWNEMSGVPVEIVGVGFFDRAHGQTGRSPNNIEIHPILSMNFVPGVTPQPTPPQPLVPTPPQPPVAGVSWEYQMVTANTATELTAKANSLGAQGWEMVGIVLDTSRPDKYVGYLKRQK
jgi:hypothetical protein